MGLLPREATFAEEVTDFFLAFRGAGVSLSPLDADVLLGWQDRGVPYEVVCRGIRKAAEKRARDKRPDEPALKSLRACARAVEEEWMRFQGAATGKSATKAPPEVAQDRLAKVRAALSKAAREGNPAVHQAAERVRALAVGKSEDPALAATRVAHLDDAFALLYLRALPFSTRLQVLRDVRTQLGSALPRMSPRARKAALRAHRVMHARSHGALPALR